MSTGLHDVTEQLFMNTAVRTLIPIYASMILAHSYYSSKNTRYESMSVGRCGRRAIQGNCPFPFQVSKK
jgi:hypothetical protein